MYDWAWSAFSTSVTTALLGPSLLAMAGENGGVSVFGFVVDDASFFPFAISLSAIVQVVARSRFSWSVRSAMAPMRGRRRLQLVPAGDRGADATGSGQLRRVRLRLPGRRHLAGLQFRDDPPKPSTSASSRSRPRRTSWIGPALFGIVNQIVDSQQQAILALIVFFVVGIGLLIPIDVRRAMLDAGQDPDGANVA